MRGWGGGAMEERGMGQIGEGEAKGRGKGEGEEQGRGMGSD